MFSKGTRMYSILKGKCPQCHEGEFFVSRKFSFKTIGDVRETCDFCGLKYAKEPGFYYGAMYIAYGLGVAVFVTLWVSFNLFFNSFAITWQIGLIISAIVITGPFLYSLSKIIYANMFISYKADALNIKEK